MLRIAVIPGSFDPVTVGHMDIALRAASLFDRVIVTAFDNSSKSYMFSAAQRLEMLNVACSSCGCPNVSADLTDILLADYVREKGACAIVKGVRGAADYDYEYQLSQINRSIGGGIETVLLPARHEHLFLSSTMVRELIKYGKPLDGYVPPEVIEYLRS
ncbi:MAG: pantetheine-phosphate adenylyltransferase [Eubacteriales bacterium]